MNSMFESALSGRQFKSFAVSRIGDDGWKITIQFEGNKDDRITLSYSPTKTGRKNFTISLFDYGKFKATARRLQDDKLVVYVTIPPLVSMLASISGIEVPSKMKFIIDETGIIARLGDSKNDIKFANSFSLGKEDDVIVISGNVMDDEFIVKLWHGEENSVSTVDGEKAVITKKGSSTISVSINGEITELRAEASQNVTISGAIYDRYFDDVESIYDIGYAAKDMGVDAFGKFTAAGEEAHE